MKWIRSLEEKNAKKGTRLTTKSKNIKVISQYRDDHSRLDKVQSFRYETDRRYSEGVLGHADIIKMVPELLSKYQLLRKIVAKKYPIIFVDESQDTDKAFVAALKMIDQDEGERFCLGFFGDQMQQIYSTGTGSIVEEIGWKTITKKENFRCSKAVLDLINRIRRDGDGLAQTDGLAALSTGDRTVQGSARLFIMPTDRNRGECLTLIRRWTASQESDPLWIEDSPGADVKILVIIHRMAADRLDFPDLFRALHDKGPESFKVGFNDGTLWLLRPFLQILIPLAEAVSQGNWQQVISLLREEKSPLLTHDRLMQESNPAYHLSSIKTVIEELSDMMFSRKNPGITVKECLTRLSSANLVPLDDRIVDIISDNMAVETLRGDGDGENEGNKKLQAIEAFLNCPAYQLCNYRSYLDGESPFSTQHGVKGAEFSRVLVVIDEKEGKYNLFPFDLLFGISAPSKTDQENKEEGKDNSIDRTRRLFYVCCSRARKDLAVALFTQDVEATRQKLVSMQWFDENNIFILKDLL